MLELEELKQWQPEASNNPDFHLNLSPAELQRRALMRAEGVETADGVLSVDTRPDTGRSPKDKFVVDGTDGVNYGKVNQPLGREHFEGILQKALGHLHFQPELFIQDMRVGADLEYSRNIRLVTERAWAAQFANNLFLPPQRRSSSDRPIHQGYTILHVPNLVLDASRDGINSQRAIVTDLDNGLVVIAGTHYGGEIKKSIFSAMNHELPGDGVATMHCSANMAPNGETAIFFGLSGTGKTTLSSDTGRMLIGDDEHAWTDDGIFNMEGGSYAKLISLSEEDEPLIYRAIHRPGAVLENVDLDESGRPVFTSSKDREVVENMRGAYPLSFIPGASRTGVAPHPTHLIMLTADASGVMPPVARLTPEEAMYQFISGYTSKVAGTERGVTEPLPDFSACYGAPFLTRPAAEYGRLLGEKIATHRPAIWLVNTGWPGGYREGGRMSIAHTRDIVRAILGNRLDGQPFDQDGLGFAVPRYVPGVPSENLRAENYWADREAYRERALRLETSFAENISKFEGQIPRDILASGPHFADAV